MAGIDASIPLQTQRPKIMGPGEALSLQNLAQEMTARSMQVAQMRKQQERDMKLSQIPWELDEHGLPSRATIARVSGVDKELGAKLAQQNILTLRSLSQMAADQATVDQRNLALGKEKEALRTKIKSAAVVAYEQAKAAGAPEETAERAYQEAYTSTFDEMMRSGSLSWIPQGDIAMERTPPRREVAAAQVAAPGDAAKRTEQAAEAARKAEELRLKKREDVRQEEELRLAREKAAREAAKPTAPKITPENAGKIASIRQGIKDIEDARALIITKDGFNTKLVAQMQAPFGGWGADARKLKSAIYNATDIILRLRTGAAANASEVEKMAQTFSPNILDDEKSAAYKLDRLKSMFDDALRMAEQGQGVEESPATSAAPAGGGETPVPLPKDRNALKPGTVYQTPDGPARFKGWNGSKAQFEAIEGAETREFPGAPPVGTIKNGYKFLGGNPKDKANWQKQ